VKRVRAPLLVLLAVVTLSSCDLFQRTQVIYDQETGSWELITNEKENYQNIFIALFGSMTPGTATDFKCTAEKVSGAYRVPYGAWFSGDRRPDGQFARTDMILMNAAGQYFIAHYDNQTGQDEYTVLIDWTNSSHLNEGYGVPNTVRVVYNSVGPVYDVYFNDSFETSLDFAALWDGGDYGPLIYIGSEAEEDFPKTPEDVKVRLYHGWL
jgi:hypothetical protein